MKAMSSDTAKQERHTRPRSLSQAVCHVEE
jgi:hypothetical protein